MLGVPAATEFDLKFRLLGIPVRVHPFFWVLSALLGWSSKSFSEIVVWVACVFVSIMVHEFGHGLTARALVRQNPLVVLYAMGGLCVYDSDDRRPWRRVGILLMGPVAGFLLFLLVAVVGTVVTGIAPFGQELGLPRFHETPRWVSPLVWEAYNDLLFINLVWGIFNLLPIFPLDGGPGHPHPLVDARPAARALGALPHRLDRRIAAVVATWLYHQATRPPTRCWLPISA